MKGVDKYKKTPTGGGSKKSGGDKQEFSSADRAKMIIEGIKKAGDCIEAVFSYLSEKEKTKQVQVECIERIVESNNRLEEVREKEMTKRLDICAKTLIDIEKLSNEREKIKTFKVCLHEAITTMNEFKLLYNQTGDRRLIDFIHEQNLKLLDVSKTINSLH